MYKVRSSFRFVTSAILADLSVSSFRRLLARYRFSSIFFFSPPPLPLLATRIRLYVCALLSLPTIPTGFSITSNVYPQCSTFASRATVFSCHPPSLHLPHLLLLLLHLSISLSLPLSIACRTSHRVTDPRHLLSAANCRGGPGYRPFQSFSFRKNVWTTNSSTRIVRNFVSFLVHSPVGIIELLVSMFLLFLSLFFSSPLSLPVTDSTVPIGLCLLIEKGLSLVSNPFNIAANPTFFFFLKRTAANVFPVLIRVTQDARKY